MSLKEHELAPPEATEELRSAARDAGWSDELLNRFLRLHFSEQTIRRWMRPPQDGSGESVSQAEKGIEMWERISFGTLRARDATYIPKDFDSLIDVFANSPEPIGDWEVTVERSPNPLAQFDMQENGRVRVLEDRGFFLGVFSYATQRTYVAGQEITVQYVSAYRVRKEFRGGGYSQLLNWLGASVGSPYPQGQWFHVRSQNYAAVEWMNAVSPRLLAQSMDREGDVPGFEVFVSQYAPMEFTSDGSGIRNAERSDLSSCVALINRTHQDLDFFTPYTEKNLQIRLNENLWGWRPDWWTYVYGWRDFHVVEKDGRVVACGGLWDRGANVRERWRFKETGNEKVIDSTCLIDFGFAEGHEEQMARLIEYLIGETKKSGRHHFVAPLQYQPTVAELLDKFGPVPEKRGLQWRTWTPPGPDTSIPNPPITRPYTDLVYW